MAEILFMSVFIRTKDQNVIDVNKTEWKVTQDPLESVPSVPEPEGKSKELKHTKQCDDRHFLNFILVHRHLIIPLVEI